MNRTLWIPLVALTAYALFMATTTTHAQLDDRETPTPVPTMFWGEHQSAVQAAARRSNDAFFAALDSALDALPNEQQEAVRDAVLDGLGLTVPESIRDTADPVASARAYSDVRRLFGNEVAEALRGAVEQTKERD